MFFDVIERATTAERVQPSTELSGRKKRGSHFRLIKMTPPSSTREKERTKRNGAEYQCRSFSIIISSQRSHREDNSLIRSSRGKNGMRFSGIFCVSFFVTSLFPTHKDLIQYSRIKNEGKGFDVCFSSTRGVLLFFFLFLFLHLVTVPNKADLFYFLFIYC